jgi:hypothetical protein
MKMSRGFVMSIENKTLSEKKAAKEHLAAFK